MTKPTPAKPFVPPTLTREQWESLYWFLVDTAHDMDDDGNEGAFEASFLGPIYRAVREAREASPLPADYLEYRADNPSGEEPLSEEEWRRGNEEAAASLGYEYP